MYIKSASLLRWTSTPASEVGTACHADGVQQSPYGRVVLVSGPEALLADRAVEAVVARARAEDAGVDVAEVEAVRLDAASLVELTGQSLFSSRRVAILRDLAELPAGLASDIVRLAAEPLPDVALVLVHHGGTRSKALLDQLRAAGVEVVDCPSPKPWELPQFVTAEARRVGGSIEAAAAQFLLDAVGHDLRALASAVAQLVADSEDSQVTATDVRRYFGGRAEVTSFAVADAALAGRTGTAMEHLRWAIATGVAPVLITSAMASGLRGLGKLITAGPGLREADLAREVGVPPWKLKSMRVQARGWDAGGIARALTVVATADAEVKGAADDPGFSLERAVLAVSRARRG
jgi:DNA polymerase-3 subunit delta